jgi:hypothetical protein
MSWPSLARARLTGGENGGVERIVSPIIVIFMATILDNVYENIH